MYNYYGLLMQFTQGTTPCRKHLTRHHPEYLIDEAIHIGYIIKIREQTDGDPVYAITELGRKTRDN